MAHVNSKKEPFRKIFTSSLERNHNISDIISMITVFLSLLFIPYETCIRNK